MFQRGPGKPLEQRVHPLGRGVHVHDQVVEAAQLDGLREGAAHAAVNPDLPANRRHHPRDRVPEQQKPVAFAGNGFLRQRGVEFRPRRQRVRGHAGDGRARPLADRATPGFRLHVVDVDTHGDEVVPVAPVRFDGGPRHQRGVAADLARAAPQHGRAVLVNGRHKGRLVRGRRPLRAFHAFQPVHDTLNLRELRAE